MLFALTVGGGASLFNIAVHSAAIAVMARMARAHATNGSRRRAMVRLMVVMAIALAVLMLAHTFEIWIWSLLYDLLGVAPEGANNFTFAFVNYTTLGYGNVVPMPRWEVLGPMTAMNGVLLFGLSTAVLFQILAVSSRELHISI